MNSDAKGTWVTLPLPAGEGQGEGESCKLNKPRNSSPHSAKMWSAALPAHFAACTGSLIFSSSSRVELSQGAAKPIDVWSGYLHVQPELAVGDSTIPPAEMSDIQQLARDPAIWRR